MRISTVVKNNHVEGAMSLIQVLVSILAQNTGNFYSFFHISFSTLYQIKTRKFKILRQCSLHHSFNNKQVFLL